MKVVKFYRLLIDVLTAIRNRNCGLEKSCTVYKKEKPK